MRMVSPFDAFMSASFAHSRFCQRGCRAWRVVTLAERRVGHPPKKRAMARHTSAGRSVVMKWPHPGYST